MTTLKNEENPQEDQSMDHALIDICLSCNELILESSSYDHIVASKHSLLIPCTIFTMTTSPMPLFEGHLRDDFVYSSDHIYDYI